MVGFDPTRYNVVIQLLHQLNKNLHHNYRSARDSVHVNKGNTIVKAGVVGITTSGLDVNNMQQESSIPETL